MTIFAHIQDPRERAEARLNLALRSGGAMDNALIEAMVAQKRWSLWEDFSRDVIAKHLLAAIEDEGLVLADRKLLEDAKSAIQNEYHDLASQEWEGEIVTRIEQVIGLPCKGGEHSYANAQVSHPRCNRRKGARIDVPMREIQES